MALLNRVRNILGLSPATSSAGSWTCGALAVLAAGGVCWIVWGGSPLSAMAAAADEDTLVALADGEEGEREERRDGDRPRGEREGLRDGDRPRGERDGDRPRGERDGDRPRGDGDGERREGEGRPDRPSPEQFRRHIEEMKGKARALAEQGRREEAEKLENEIRAAVARFEQRPRDGDRALADVPPEVRERVVQLQWQLGEAKEAGRADEAERLQRELRTIHERLSARREGEPRREGEGPRDRPRGDGPHHDFAPVNPELLQVIRELREEVGRLRREVDELKGGPPPRDSDRPRLDRGEGPRPDARPDRPRREGEGDRPRPDRPRDGERGEGDRRSERDRDAPPRREGGDRDREEG